MELSRHIKRLHKPFGLDLFQEVSGKSLSIFRIGFGLVMLYEMINLRSYVLRDLLNSKFFLTYDLFFWLDALPRPVMNVVLTLAGFATLFVIVPRGMCARQVAGHLRTICSFWGPREADSERAGRSG